MAVQIFENILRIRKAKFLCGHEKDHTGLTCISYSKFLRVHYQRETRGGTKTPHTAIGRERKGRNSNGGCLTLLLRDHTGILIVTW